MSNETTGPLQAPPSEWTVEPIRENLSVFETHGHYHIRLSHAIRDETGHIAYVAVSEEDAQRIVTAMRQKTTEPTGARLTDADIAELQRCVERSGTYADEWLISPDDVAALLADRAALVAEVHGWRQVAEEERRTREIAQERYGNALGEQSALEAQIAAMRPLVEALATEIDPEDDHLFCTRCVSTAGRWLGHTHEMVHEPDCIIVKARALLARESGEGTGE